MVDFLGSKVTLVCLRQITRLSFMGWLDTSTLFSGLNAWIVVFDVGHEEYLEAVDLTAYVGTIIYPLGLPLTSLRDLPLLNVYFQVNNGVLYYLDYVEDIYIRALFFPVSTLNPNIVFTTSNKLYTTIRTSLFPFQSLNQNHM